MVYRSGKRTVIEAMGSLFLLLDRIRDEGREMLHTFKIWDDFLFKDIAS